MGVTGLSPADVSALYNKFVEAFTGAFEELKCGVVGKMVTSRLELGFTVEHAGVKLVCRNELGPLPTRVEEFSGLTIEYYDREKQYIICKTGYVDAVLGKLVWTKIAIATPTGKIYYVVDVTPVVPSYTEFTETLETAISRRGLH